MNIFNISQQLYSAEFKNCLLLYLRFEELSVILLASLSFGQNQNDWDRAYPSWIHWGALLPWRPGSLPPYLDPCRLLRRFLSGIGTLQCPNRRPDSGRLSDLYGLISEFGLLDGFGSRCVLVHCPSAGVIVWDVSNPSYPRDQLSDFFAALQIFRLDRDSNPGRSRGSTKS